ncbi:MAG: DNA helicase UvrD [Candidatus Colwellbacteria bacterium RIFCSPLOWO2_12_FULL_44_13]|uniref:DNA helicase UvrD n=3 Tax=Candidatus Colwelliibacteriota TaxID=1817904 RepID=A0A1G1Z6K3_9BACT|nr:MAG: DNA helicase UvrD [Candidatus Colwellbacteria bacterium RIFCSPHIGHO2_12_FULL_44_17]OGY60248.1 MAG: DNA helicase UvrD [Candidatus Colwellbacteria bacterium RIFCSPLOWO2_02_FULL_44_20b]OGY62056.1 MAG: DNA helicase UvrD [Candidatus Colwellbacteria bacterium RIFCSPLOWO2_12_FULL_44_13]
MKIIADLHIHSPYARAVSKEMTLENLDAWAGDKGITIMGTGDFTHPKWLKEIKEKLEPAEPGLFKVKAAHKVKNMKGKFSDTRFMLTTEISSIYKRGGKVRKVHNLLFVPDVETIEKIYRSLLMRGANLHSDGRPIIGIDSEDLLKTTLEANPEALFIPAHAWTPWFSVFGSMSGFDSLEECFGDNTKYVYAIETGLSSDPPMNWRISKLDKIALISNSDSHSLQRIGREANEFDIKPSFNALAKALKEKNPKNFLRTLEFFPEEGKYHYDGHRVCKKCLAPSETKKLEGKCPVCGKPVTVGVMNRVDALADRPEGFKDEKKVGYKNMIPLDEIIGEAFDVGPTSKRVKEEYKKMIIALDTELKILFEASDKELKEAGTKTEVIEGILRVREGEVRIDPGYDGEYGKIKIFEEKERASLKTQNPLFY